MKKLRFDRISEDRRGFVLRKVSDGQEFLLPLDEALAGAVRGLEVPDSTEGVPVEGEEADAETPQTPEASIGEIPKDKGAAIAAVRNQSLGAKDGDGQTVEERVKASLEAKMLRLPDRIFDSSWGADARRGGGWIVKFDYVSAGQHRTAEWLIDDMKREVRPLNDIAEDLLKPRSGTAASAKNAGRGRRRRA